MITTPKKIKLAIVDTMFARVDMGAIAIDEIKKHYAGGADGKGEIEVERRTVPGIKDLAVECKRLLDGGCDVALALGMVGGAPIDTVCGHEASLGIQQAKLLTNKHIIEVFVHENEAWSEQELLEIFENRTRKHVHNAVALAQNPKHLTQFAGLGVRQGKDDEGTLDPNKKQAITLGLVVGKFNRKLTERMEKKASEVARKLGASLCVVLVPGAYDMPLAVKKLLMDKRIVAVATLGAVIKGDTDHDKIVAKNTARALTKLSLEFKKPVTLGIIGPGASEEAADARAEEYAERAVTAAVELVKVLSV